MKRILDLDADMQKDIAILKERTGDDFNCPICKHDTFGIVPGFFRHITQHDEREINLGGPSINTLMLICGHCGYILEFAISVLHLKVDEENGS